MELLQPTSVLTSPQEAELLDPSLRERPLWWFLNLRLQTSGAKELESRALPSTDP